MHLQYITITLFLYIIFPVAASHKIVSMQTIIFINKQMTSQGKPIQLLSNNTHLLYNILQIQQRDISYVVIRGCHTLTNITTITCT